MSCYCSDPACRKYGCKANRDVGHYENWPLNTGRDVFKPLPYYPPDYPPSRPDTNTVPVQVPISKELTDAEVERISDKVSDKLFNRMKDFFSGR